MALLGRTTIGRTQVTKGDPWTYEAEAGKNPYAEEHSR